jgi:outer membrane lipoprotein-sorting protein
MLFARSIALPGCLLAILVSTPACLVRRTIISHRGLNSGSPRPLITASREDLVHRLTAQYDALRSFNATVDMTPETGSVYKGEITDYKDIRAYILYRKSSDIRIIGLAPVVRTKVFDMVSTGENFRILIPPQNRFIEGRNDAPPTSKNSLENLRPEAFLRSMTVPPPDPSLETPLLVDATDEEDSLYVMVIIGKTAKGELMIDRAIFFDRTTLMVTRQKEYDSGGTILSDTRYTDWKTANHIAFPQTIHISRPKDGYGVVISVVKLETNPDITDDKFVLEQPPGSVLQTIGSAILPVSKAPAP